MYEVITAQENGQYNTDEFESYEATLEHYLYLRDGGTRLNNITVWGVNDENLSREFEEKYQAI